MRDDMDRGQVSYGIALRDAVRDAELYGVLTASEIRGPYKVTLFSDRQSAERAAAGYCKWCEPKVVRVTIKTEEV